MIHLFIVILGLLDDDDIPLIKEECNKNGLTCVSKLERNK